MIFGKPKYLRAILLTKEGDHSHKEIGLLFGQSFSMKYMIEHIRVTNLVIEVFIVDTLNHLTR